jgi:uncharacterized protein (DUF2342 family)
VSEPEPRQIGIVDWELAERLAVALAGDGPRWDGSEEELRSESDRAAKLVRRYTGLKPKGRLPEAELIARDEWATVNFATCPTGSRWRSRTGCARPVARAASHAL